MGKVKRKEEILTTACHLFSQKGYHGTTMRDISEACGILAGSLYTHIRSKEDLLYEITDRGAQSFLQSLQQVVNSEKSAAEKLRLALRAHIQVVAENIEAATVFFHEWKALTGERRKQIQKKRDQYELMWKQILLEGIQSGELHDLDGKFARLLLLSVGNWLYQWYKPDGKLSVDEIVDRFMTILLYGFLGQKEGIHFESGRNVYETDQTG
ncbi:TetR/AcrR family transcriptional regulator [Thermoflavimicrobium daqui]|jgi:AcrR family transcriptional regulator|uniref:TetR/AcrR family transcriptional regulator n=1 Tax=Thermoflavimicrobium daqui TaxID=2137476 RepID=A0A364K9H0_9BACL|nr:TetR/AcrR family transcriptional regulator [Thermoflavimicrobium daqui]RAL26946.1 TetR/AcrR family transcriptional regulator [Thermoflavimicrobium daqui]